MKMNYEIKNRWNGQVIFSLETTSLKLCVQAAIKSEANLREADLREADLRGASLREANLYGADLYGANLDFSSGFSFKCSSFNIKLDLKLAAQMAYHFCRMDFGNEKEAKEAQVALKSLANKFHRIDGCEKIK